MNEGMNEYRGKTVGRNTREGAVRKMLGENTGEGNFSGENSHKIHC